jgi:hypothetical protein
MLPVLSGTPRNPSGILGMISGDQKVYAWNKWTHEVWDGELRAKRKLWMEEE